VLKKALLEDGLLEGIQRSVDASKLVDVLVTVPRDEGIGAPLIDVVVPVPPRQASEQRALQMPVDTWSAFPMISATSSGLTVWNFW
jgi:hypothetical protein